VARKALLLYIEFFQLKLQQAHVADIACDAGNLYSVTDSDSALSNQEEGAETGENDVLECEQESGAEQPKVGCD
jgi:hypothetical protein